MMTLEALTELQLQMLDQIKKDNDRPEQKGRDKEIGKFMINATEVLIEVAIDIKRIANSIETIATAQGKIASGIKW